MEEEQRIVGEIEAIYFENDRNFYKVMRISIDHEATDLLLGNEIVITGQFAAVHYDTQFEFFGNLTNHPKYGEQFAVTRYQQLTPTSESGLVDYLASHRFKGIGPTLAQRIVDELGTDAISEIINNGNVLNKVKGLTKKTRDNLRQVLVETQGTERIFIQLSEWGFGAKLADKIYRQYESKTLEVIKNNPYELIQTIEGVGFPRADRLAENLGFDGSSKERLAASLYMAVFEICQSDGDTYVPRDQAITQARKLLEEGRNDLIDLDLMEASVDVALNDEILKELDGNLMIPSLYYAELNLARNIDAYLEYNEMMEYEEAEIIEKIELLEEMTGFVYDESQKQALLTATQSTLSIITGGPGTGKTTLIKGLIQLHALLNDYDLEKVTQIGEDNPILLAAPTGRAAKRMQEATGLPASTIHRMIGFNIDTEYTDTSVEILDGSLLIIDEMSMVDTWLMNWLLQAIPYHMQVILVGDKNQLPSVGPGKVFTDLIESGIAPVMSLKKIYRQAEGSSIISLAHAIQEGNLPQDFLELQPDRAFIPAGTRQIPQAIAKIVKAALKRGYDGSTMQVLAPMYKGEAGINALNQLLQEIMNPRDNYQRELVHFDTVLREGDKVLQLINRGEDEVYNGDIGIISRIYDKSETESKSDEIIVSYDNNKEILYSRREFDQLTLAYCTSIHKAQGSEYPLVILPIVTRYSRMLQKDILYTAVTRAKKSLTMLGNPNSFYQAVSNVRPPRRTNLKELLQLTYEAEDEEDDSEVQEQQPLVLTNETFWEIDPMIGMEGISPHDFMPQENKSK